MQQNCIKVHYLCMDLWAAQRGRQSWFCDPVPCIGPCHGNEISLKQNSQDAKIAFFLTKSQDKQAPVTVNLCYRANRLLLSGQDTHPTMKMLTIYRLSISTLI